MELKCGLDGFLTSWITLGCEWLIFCYSVTIMNTNGNTEQRFLHVFLRNGLTLPRILNAAEMPLINSDALSWLVQAHCGQLKTSNVESRMQ